MKSITHLGLSCALLPAALAYSADYVVPEWYHVEVIVFSQQDLYESEQPRRDVTLRYPKNRVLLQAPAGARGQEDPEQSDAAEPSTDAPGVGSLAQLSAIMHNQSGLEAAAPVILETPFQRLAKEDRLLAPDAYTLKRAPGYRVLFHEAWRQPAQPRKEAPWVIIQGGKQFGGHFELEGSLRLYKSRHLHLQSNLWKVRYELQRDTFRRSPLMFELDSDIPREVEEPWPDIPDVPQLAPRSLSSLPETSPIYGVLEVVTLKHSEKITPKTMHYLDHPNMGVLVIIKPYEVATIEETAAEQALLE